MIKMCSSSGGRKRILAEVPGSHEASLERPGWVLLCRQVVTRFGSAEFRRTPEIKWPHLGWWKKTPVMIGEWDFLPLHAVIGFMTRFALSWEWQRPTWKETNPLLWTADWPLGSSPVTLSNTEAAHMHFLQRACDGHPFPVHGSPGPWSPGSLVVIGLETQRDDAPGSWNES